MAELATFSDSFNPGDDLWKSTIKEWKEGGKPSFIIHHTAKGGPIEPASPESQPWLCPHCRRDRHPGPLRRRAAAMLDGMMFDPKYDAAADDSPIICIGADYHGPHQRVIDSTTFTGWDNQVNPSLPQVYKSTAWTQVKAEAGPPLPHGSIDIKIVPSFVAFAEGLKTALFGDVKPAVDALVKSFVDLSVAIKLWHPGEVIQPPPCALPDGLPVITFGPPYPIEHPLKPVDQAHVGLFHFELFPEATQVIQSWWYTITKAVYLDAISFELPPTPGYDFTHLADILEYHPPQERNHHERSSEGQRIPRRSQRRNRQPLHPRHDAQQRRRRM